MPFVFKMLADGGTTPMALDLPLTNASVAENLVGVDTSGYVGAAGDAPDLHTIIGVTDATVDNSGGSAGDKVIPMIISRSAIYEATTTGTPTQAQMHDVVSLDASSVVDEDDPISANTEKGIVKLIKLISGSSKKVWCRIVDGVNSNA